jgi:hypothetical protein
MHVGIIGHHPGILTAAIATTEDLGHTAIGTTSDEEAMSWLAGKVVSALVIGGGVEPASRSMLLGACTQYGVRPVEVFGPDNLRAALASLV